MERFCYDKDDLHLIIWHVANPSVYGAYGVRDCFLSKDLHNDQL